MIRVIVLHAGLKGHVRPPPRGLPEGLAYAKRLELESASEDARRASLAGLGLVLDAVGMLTGTRPGPGELRFPAGGKPFLPGGPSFSISHSDTRVACAVAANCDIGIDVEDLTADSAGRPGRQRLTRWTATESTLKAAGAGLRAASDVRLSVELSRAWFADAEYLLTALDLGPGLVGYAATTQAVDEWTISPV